MPSTRSRPCPPVAAIGPRTHRRSTRSNSIPREPAWVGSRAYLGFETQEENMASVEQRTPAQANGGAAQTIPVENPATGQVAGTIAVLGPAELEAMADRARSAQPQWEAIG